jgi:hypothetical protein
LNVLATTTWAANEIACGFTTAMGRQKVQFREDIQNGALGLSVDVLIGNDIDTMRRRLARAGRVLADEFKRKRLRSLARMPLLPCPPKGIPGLQFACLESRLFGVALRVVQQWHPVLGREVYRASMLGSRYRVPA